MLDLSGSLEWLLLMDKNIRRFAFPDLYFERTPQANGLRGSLLFSYR
jgi:hypothetical protein